MSQFLPTHPAVPVDDDALSELTAFAGQLADAAGEAIRPHFRRPIEVEDKGRGSYDPVTEADRGAERAMRRLIRSRYPDHGILGEELGHESVGAGLTWVLDPIDGTRSFITGSHAWGTLIALYNGERSILGVLDQPCTHERFIGSRHGTSLTTPEGGRQALRSRRCLRLADAVLASTHPDLFRRPVESAAFQLLCRRVRLVRFGGDCYSYAMLAHGFIDLVVESDLAPYDVQALVPIVEGAGGIATSWSGGPAGENGQLIAAGDRNLHAEVLVFLRHCLG
jgi:histidinol phosphatase-like enzyme (inositol monophosphatase family)